jgi:hypothetical protein
MVLDCPITPEGMHIELVLVEVSIISWILFAKFDLSRRVSEAVPQPVLRVWRWVFNSF